MAFPFAAGVRVVRVPGHPLDHARQVVAHDEQVARGREGLRVEGRVALLEAGDVEGRLAVEADVVAARNPGVAARVLHPTRRAALWATKKSVPPCAGATVSAPTPASPPASPVPASATAAADWRLAVPEKNPVMGGAFCASTVRAAALAPCPFPSVAI